jgi:5'-3' exonuclease
VWGCLSEDTDLFVYGCTNVLRYFSLLNHTVVLYNTKKILEELNLTQDEFRELCVVSGTDYSAHFCQLKETVNMFKVWKLFQKYQKEMNLGEVVSFYSWLHEKKNTFHFEALEKINRMFDLNSLDKSELKKQVDNIQIKNGPFQKERMQTILKEDGFVFPCV